MDSDPRLLLYGALIGGFFALAGAVGGPLVESSTKDRELDVKMLEIALGILREDPSKSQITAARGWAVDIINDSTSVTMSPEVKKELLKQKLPNVDFSWGYSYDDVPRGKTILEWKDLKKRLNERDRKEPE